MPTIEAVILDGPRPLPGADYTPWLVSFLCEPSQKGLPAVCLQPQSHTFCASVTVNFDGENSEPLCEPSQNGWRFERPQAHHQ